jgi:hypothetical protein
MVEIKNLIFYEKQRSGHPTTLEFNVRESEPTIEALDSVCQVLDSVE